MKKLFSFALGVAVLFSFASCREKKNNDGKITLTVWESSNGPDEFIRQAGAVYTQAHPNVLIKYVNVELGDSSSQIALDGPAGKGPDIFAASHDRLSSLVAGGHVLPTVSPDEIKSLVLPACSKALTYEGTMYGYPVSAETYALFYNKTLIKENEVPKTWEELAAFAKKFNSENPGKYGFVMNVGEGYYTNIFTTEKGNRLFGPDGTDRKHTNINSEVAVDGMKFFQSLRSALDVPSSDLGTSTVDAMFQSGMAAIHITGLWNVVPFEKAKVDFGVTTLPALPGETTPAVSFSGTRTMFVSAYSDYPSEANDFAAFLVSREMQALRFKITGALPSVKINAKSQYVNGFMNQLEYSFPMPSVPEMTLYWEAINNASKNIWDGADVKKELDACNTTILGK